MIQCPNCFSWVNDSVIDICPNCGERIFPPTERTPVSAERPPIPALGRSIVSMAFGIHALLLSMHPLVMAMLVVFADADIVSYIYVFVSCAIISIFSGVAVHNARIAYRAGNRSHMQQIGKRMGVISFSILFASIAITLLGLLR